jgi:hypothetical protein
MSMFGVRRRHGRHVGFTHPGDAQHVEHQHAVIGRDGAPALRDDGGMRHFDFVAHVLHVVNDVVGVLLQGVVDAGFEIGLRAVVIDAQPAAHVQVLQPGAGARQIYVHADGFVHRALDLADIGDLAAQVEVQQVEAVAHAEFFQFLQRAHRLGGRKSELRAVSARGFPAPRPAAGQLDAQADGRPHAHALAIFQDQVQFGVFFHYRDNLAAQFLGEHGHLDVFIVLEAVADDRGVVVGQRHHGHQFRFGTGFQAEAERLAEFEHLFHHLALLVDLDGVDAAVTALVLVLVDGGFEGAVDLSQAVLQNIGEADQDRQVDAAQDQRVHQLFEVNRARGFLLGVHQDVPVLAHRKVALAPARDVV